WYKAMEAVLLPFLEAAHTLTSPPPLEILNVGCGVGLQALFIGRIIGQCFSKHLHRPHPSVHITGIDTMLSSVFASRKLLRSNRLALAETFLAAQTQRKLKKNQDPKFSLAWIPFSLFSRSEDPSSTLERGSTSSNPKDKYLETTRQTSENEKMASNMLEDVFIRDTASQSKVSLPPEASLAAATASPPTKNGSSLASSTQETEKDRQQASLLLHWQKETAYVDARFQFLYKEIRQLRPPVKDSNQQTALMLATAEAYGIPMGENLEQTLPPVTEEDFLKHRVNLMVWTTFDTGLLGEGILPLGKYAWKALMMPPPSPPTVASSSPSLSHCLPIQASLYAMCIQLGIREIETMDLSPWSMQKYLGDYFALDLSATVHTCLSDPFKVFDFDFDSKGFNKQEQYARQREFLIPINTCGVFNAIVFWYVLDLDAHNSVTNAPFFSTSKSSYFPSILYGGKTSKSSSSQVNGPSYFHFTRKQACQMVEEITVYKNESIPLQARQNSSTVSFTLQRNAIIKFQQRRTQIPLFDTISSHLNKQCSTIAHSISSTLLTNTAANRMAARAALKIAIDPGRQSAFAIDPQEAA
ncbi:hypothetical protein IE077_000910, partial [Cardiosporidium cionae]